MKLGMYLSLVTASVSFTITESKLYTPFREWVKKKSGFLGELFSCSYCLGHWVAFGLVAIYTPKLFEVWWLLNYFLTTLVIAWPGGIQGIFMCWFMQKAGK